MSEPHESGTASDAGAPPPAQDPSSAGSAAPPPRRRGLRIALAAFVAFLALLASVGGWLLFTEPGLHRALALVEQLPIVTLRFEGARGSIVGPLEIDRIVVDHERVRVEARHLRTDLRLTSVPLLLVDLDYVQLADVEVQVKPRVNPPDDLPPRFLPAWLALAVADAKVDRLAIRVPSGTTVEIRRIAAARTKLTQKRIVVEGGTADGGVWAASGDATLLAADPLGLEGAGRFVVRVGERRFEGDATARGDLETLVVDATLTAPRGARFAGRLRLVDDLTVDGRATLDRFEPKDVAAGDTTGPISGALDVKGAIDSFTASGRLEAAKLPLGPIELALTGGYADRALAVERFTALAPRSGARASANGTIAFAAPVRIEFDGEWANLRWPLAGRNVVVASPAGTFSIAGDGDFAYTVDTSLRGPQVPEAAIAARGRVNADRVELAAVDVRALRGHITGSGEVSWRGTRPWAAKLDARGIDPGLVRAPLAGRVNVSLAASGQGFEPLGHWDARIARLDGTVRGQPARGRGDVRVRGGEFDVSGLDVTFGSAQVQAQGHVGRRSDLEWRLRVDDLGSFLADAGGSIRSRGQVVGSGGRTSVQGTVGARSLKWGEFRAAQVVIDVDLDPNDREASYLKLSALGVGRGTAVADQLRVALDGRASDHRLVVRATRAQDWAELVTHGRYEPQPGVWTLALEDFRVQGPPLLSYRLESPATLRLQRDGALLTSTCFVREAERICAAGTWSAKTPWALALDATRLPLQLLPLALPPDTRYAGTVSVDATVRGAPDAPWTAEAGLLFADAEFSYRAPSGRTEVVRVGSGRAALRVAPDFYGASIGLATVNGSSVTGNAQVPRTDAPLAEAALTGDLALTTSELGWLPIVLPDVDRFAGNLEARLQLGGTLGAPQLQGYVTFVNGEMDVYRTNLLLRQVNARIDFAGDAIALDARLATKGGTAHASGRLAWRERSPVGTLRFEGENLLVADLPEARVLASPTLQFAVDGRRIDVSGEVRIPQADIKPKDLRGAVLASGDERIVGAERESDGGDGFAVTTSVRLVLGDKVKIDAYGLTGTLGGALRVTARPDEVPIGSGELNVKDGKYTAYTRELDIDRGRLLFAGQDIGNPGLDIRAQRRLVSATTGETVIAGINVRGTLLRPQLSFYSDPSMSQSQIASMIIVGRTLDDVQDTDRTALGSDQTRQQLVAQGSALLAGQLGRYVGLDDVAVEQGANNATSVVIGKFLSPRLYVSYGVSLTEQINTLKLRYTIGDRWVIRTESGLRQSADIEYTIER